MPAGDCPPSGRHDARASLSTARTPQCQGHSTERGQLQDVTRPSGLRANDCANPGTTQFLAPTSPAHHQFRYKTRPAIPAHCQFRYKPRPARAARRHFRYKTRPARPKWPHLARFPLAGRVLSRFCRQQAEQGEFSPAPAPPHHGHERNNTPTQRSKPRGETFTAPAPHTNPRNETFTAPTRHKQPKITHFHHAGANFLSQHPPPTHTRANFLSTTSVKTKPTNSRMQFHTAPPHHNLTIRRIPTIKPDTMKHP